MKIAYTGDFYQSNILSPVKGIFHAYSTKKAGDMQEAVNRKKFLMQISAGGVLAVPRQVHGVGVAHVHPGDRGFIPDTDALIFQKTTGGKPDTALGVLTADCAPIVFTDTKGTVIAVAHAGWKGTLGGISVNVVNQFTELGINTRDILVSIGPHIGACCYDVPKDRAARFLSLNANDPRVAAVRNDSWYIDLGYTNRLQLQKAGISNEHIESDAPCTSCDVDDFYSFRRDTKAEFGEIIGVIGFL